MNDQVPIYIIECDGEIDFRFSASFDEVKIKILVDSMNDASRHKNIFSIFGLTIPAKEISDKYSELFHGRGT